MQQVEHTVKIQSWGFLGNIQRSQFIRNNAVFFVGAVLLGALNYLYYPVMGRLLQPGSFGEVQTLFSLFAQITIFLNVLSLLTVNIVTNYTDTARRNRIILELEKLGILVSGILLIATVLGQALLKEFFNFGDSWPFVMLGLAVLLATPLTFRTGYLRGKQRFGLVSLSGLTASACGLVFAVLLVKAGFGTTGALFGLVLAQLAGFAFASRAARQNGFSESLRGSLMRLPDLKLILPELKYAALVLVGSLAITGLYSIDTLAVKHYFDAHTAGLYAGIATAARIIFFLTASIAQVLLPAVRMHQSPPENRRVLGKSFMLLTGIGGAAFAMFWLAPGQIIRLLMGDTYLPYADLLPRLSLAVFLISILNLFIMYHMALRRYAVMAVAIAGILVTLGALQANHETLQAVINSLLYGSLAMLAMLGLWRGTARIQELSNKEAS